MKKYLQNIFLLIPKSYLCFLFNKCKAKIKSAADNFIFLTKKLKGVINMATVSNGSAYRFKSKSDGKYLNILTDGNLSNDLNVTTYALTRNDLGQVWKCDNFKNGSLSGMLMRSKKNTAYVLDRWRGNSNYNNANIYTVGKNDADLKDELVVITAQSDGYSTIKLKYYNLYLTATSTNTYGGHNVNWQPPSNSSNQRWFAESYENTTPPSNLIDINHRNKISSYNQNYSGYNGNYKNACAGICGCMAIKKSPNTVPFDYVYPANWTELAKLVNKSAVAVNSKSLSKVLDILKSGYPVIVKTRDTALNPGYYDHWVIIYGYKGSSTNISASNFKCIDPSNSSSIKTGKECALTSSNKFKQVSRYVYFH